MNVRRWKRWQVIAIATLLASVAAGSAGAFWIAGGDGAGTVSAGSVATVTLSPGATTADLYPGMSGDVAVSIDNTNAYQVSVGSLALDTGRGSNGFSVDDAHAACDPAALSYTTQSNGGAGWLVPANSTLDLDLTDALSLGGGAARECQGASFSVYLQAAA